MTPLVWSYHEATEALRRGWTSALFGDNTSSHELSHRWSAVARRPSCLPAVRKGNAYPPSLGFLWL